MSYIHIPQPPQRHQNAVSCVVPRAESVLLIATSTTAEVDLGAAHGMPACRGLVPIEFGTTRLLVTGERQVKLRGRGFQALAFPDSVARLLAFHDHAKGVQRTLSGDRRWPAMLAINERLDRPQAAQRWLMEQLLGSTPDFPAVAARWARREVYHLVRFVLENPDEGVQQLADRYGLSVAQFRRIGRRAFGRSLKEQLRLLRAGRVLHRYAETGHTFTRLSSDFGFSSPSHFCSEIKSLLGRSPSSIYQSVHSL